MRSLKRLEALEEIQEQQRRTAIDEANAWILRALTREDQKTFWEYQEHLWEKRENDDPIGQSIAQRIALRVLFCIPLRLARWVYALGDDYLAHRRRVLADYRATVDYAMGRPSTGPACDAVRADFEKRHDKAMRDAIVRHMLAGAKWECLRDHVALRVNVWEWDKFIHDLGPYTEADHGLFESRKSLAHKRMVKLYDALADEYEAIDNAERSRDAAGAG